MVVIDRVSIISASDARKDVGSTGFQVVISPVALSTLTKMDEN
jgi:hypothetical protein